MDMTPEQIIQGTDAALDKALMLSSIGDDIYNPLSGAMTWDTGDNQEGNVVLVVPAGADFYATDIQIFLAARRLDQSDPQGNETDLTFRPAMWTSTPNVVPSTNNYKVQDANASWKMTDTYNGTYQGGSGLSIGAAYSHRYGQGSALAEAPLSAWPGARRFYERDGRRLKAGSTVTVTITPTFSRAQNESPVKTQFQATVVMNGYKRVRRFG